MAIRNLNMLRGGKRRWWLRVPLFIVFMVCVALVGWFLHMTNPTISLGRDLEELGDNDKIAVLAMIDQIKINRYQSGRERLVLNKASSYEWVKRICLDTSSPAAHAAERAAAALGYEMASVHCAEDVGYFFYLENRTDEYIAGFKCEGWCGGGNGYALTRVGPILILWRVSNLYF